MLIDLSCLWCDVIIKLKIIEFVCVLLFLRLEEKRMLESLELWNRVLSYEKNVNNNSWLFKKC